MFGGFGQVASQEQPPLADPASPPRFERPPPLCALGFLDHAPMNIWPTRSDSRIHLARQMGGRCCTSAHRAPVAEHRASEVPRIPCLSLGLRRLLGSPGRSAPFSFPFGPPLSSAFAAFWGPSAVRPFPFGGVFCALFGSPPGLSFPFSVFRFSWFLRPTVASSPPHFGRGPGAPPGPPRSRLDPFADAPSPERRTLDPRRAAPCPPRRIAHPARGSVPAAVAGKTGPPSHSASSDLLSAAPRTQISPQR